MLLELSKSQSLSEKIGSANGAILILVGMTSSKSENNVAVKNAEKTLENLELCDKNVRQMAENGRLQPLIKRLVEGNSYALVSLGGYHFLSLFFIPLHATKENKITLFKHCK